MESPVRICLSAAIVVHLLVLSSSNAHSSAIPPPTPSESQAAALEVRRTKSGYARVNSTTWLPRRSTAKPEDDLQINDISPTTNSVESVQTLGEKPKILRGPVRYNSQKYKSSTPAYRRRGLSTTTTTATTSKKPDVEVVTPTPAQKNVSQIIDSMKSYSKLTKTSYSSTTAAPDTEYEVDEDDSFSTDDHEDNEFDITRFTSSEFHDEDNVYSFSPSSSGDLYPHSSNTKDFSGMLTQYSHGPQSEPYKQSTSHSYDNFFSELDLTSPPRNYQFDKRYNKIADSINHNIDRHISMSTMPDSTHTENIEGVDVTKPMKVEQFLNKKPSNRSQTYIHKTKSITVTDNEAEGSSLSDVHGTSIYFETSILSTESYGTDIITEGDCDNDSRTEESTPSTPLEKEEKLPARVTTSPTMTTTETSERPTGTNYPSRNMRVSPKRINLSRASSKEITKESAFTNKSDDPSSNSLLKPTVPRRIQFTTKRPRTRIHVDTSQSTKSSYPTTIYAEHFNIKDKSPSDTPDRKQSLLTTVSSNIDPVYETEISGTKKEVHSQTRSDNSIPGLRKRGSTKFVTSPATEAFTLEESSSEYMPIPTASSSWAALAGNIKTPASSSFAVNSTSLRTKTVDENELQNVSEISVIQPSSTTSTTTTTISNSINIDRIQEHPQNLDQQWIPLHSPPQSISATTAPSYSSSDVKVDVTAKPIESPPTTQPSKLSPGKFESDATSASTSTIGEWEPVINTVIQQTQNTTNIQTSSNNELDPNAKLISNLRTPLSEKDMTSTSMTSNILEDLKNSSDVPINMITETTTFTHVPISTISSNLAVTTDAPVEEQTTITTLETVEPSTWHPVFPALNTNRDTKLVEDITITTYRPTFVASEVTETTYPTESQTVTVSESLPITTPSYVNESSPTTTTEKSEDITMINVKYTIRRETTTPRTTPTTTTEATTTQVAATITEEVTTPKPEETTAFVVELNITAENKETSTDKNVTEVVTHEATIEMTDAEITTTGNDEVDTTTVGKIIINENLTTLTAEVVTEHTTEGDAATRLGSTFSDMTTYSPNTTDLEESSSAAGIAIAVSTIGVIALLLLIGLLLVLRRRRQRGRRCGVYAQRCTPVSLDAYSLDSVSVGRRKGAPRLRASKRSYGNPAYDDEVVISHPMQYAALANFALDAESMAAEFAEIPAVSVRADEVPPGCETKNRYSNVLPLPETRVPLRRIGDDPTTEYINANFVTGPGNIKNYYIACQAPLANTVGDFWRMIWEQDSRLIVMLTEYMENGVEKSYEYLPPSEVTDNKRTFGNYQVVLRRREHRDKYAVSSVQLVELTTRRWREVTHLWYFWPAKGVPEDYDSVINFVSEMRGHMKVAQNAKEFDEEGAETSVDNGLRSTADGSPGGGGRRVYSPQRAEEMMRSNGANGTLGRMKEAAENGGVRPCVVTCASGAGRTGALLALELCARALEGAGTVDVPHTVRALRSARPHALQNKSQYMFLYKVLSEYGNKLTGGGADSI